MILRQRRVGAFDGVKAVGEVVRARSGPALEIHDGMQERQRFSRVSCTKTCQAMQRKVRRSKLRL